MLNFVLNSLDIRYIGKISPIKSNFSIHDGIHDGFQGGLSVNLFLVLQNLMQVVKDVKCNGIGLVLLLESKQGHCKDEWQQHIVRILQGHRYSLCPYFIQCLDQLFQGVEK